MNPIFFGPGRGNPPTHRFDSAGGYFGVLYAGMSRRAALAETILRNHQRLMVAMNDIVSRSVSIPAHPDQPDGIAYQSRHDSGEICVALFERGDMRFDIEAATPLSATLKEIADMLGSYSKSLSPGRP